MSEGGIVTITKKFDFCYGHCLPGYNGKCVNQHGHNSTRSNYNGLPLFVIILHGYGLF